MTMHARARWRLVAGSAIALVLATTAISTADAATTTATKLKPTTATPSTHTTATQAGTAGYAINEPACAPATKPHQVTCFAVRRTPVAKGTKNAYAVPAGLGGGPAGGYTPGQLATLYGYNANTSATTQTVGIIDWYDDPNIAANLKTFSARYGLPVETATSFRKVNQTGATSPLPSATNGKGTATEIALDVETVRSVCHTCKIILVEANGPTDADLAIAENTAVRLGATEISNSFGEPEQSTAASVLAAYSHPGVVITASTGDDGWYGWDVANSGTLSPGVPSFPSSDPNVVAVGGTGFNNQVTGAQAQYVWNNNGADDLDALNTGQKLGGGGGGCSKLYTAQYTQSHFYGYNPIGCGGKRLASDVSALADPQSGFDVYDTWGGTGWETIGGTSLASPMVAAMYALAGGSGGAVYPSASIYVNAKYHPTTKTDITVGGNGFCAGDTTTGCANAVYDYSGGTTNNPNGFGGGVVDCSFPRSGANVTSAPALSPECNAVTGYDGPSGVGTPKGVGLFVSTTPKLTFTAPAVTHGEAATFKAAATESISGATVTSYTFGWGDGTTATTSSSATATHTYATAGAHTITLLVKDNLGQQSVLYRSVTAS